MPRKATVDNLIGRIYCRTCSGVQIDVMDIGRVFNAGRAAVKANPDITQEELTQVIRDFVETVKRN